MYGIIKPDNETVYAVENSRHYSAHYSRQILKRWGFLWLTIKRLQGENIKLIKKVIKDKERIIVIIITKIVVNISFEIKSNIIISDNSLAKFSEAKALAKKPDKVIPI